MATEDSNVEAGASASPTATPGPGAGPQAPSALVAVVSVCAVVVMCGVVWATYAAFGEQSFDMQQTVLRPLAAWVAATTQDATGPGAPTDHLAVARESTASRILR